MDEHAPTFGALLQHSRDGARLTRKELATTIGLDPSYLYRLEIGDRRPSRDVAVALGDALGIDDDKLNQWLIAAGHAPSPHLRTVRAAVRTRGIAHVRTGVAHEGEHWGTAGTLNRLEQLGLDPASVQRLVGALSCATYAEQNIVAGAIRRTLSYATRALETPYKTAVIPAAGGQHRLLAPHMMLRLLLVAASEASSAGLRKLVFVLPPGAGESLFAPLREAVALAVAPPLELKCIEQRNPGGLGEAVLLSKALTADEPFAVLLPDDVLRRKKQDAVPSDLARILDVARDNREASIIAVAQMARARLPGSGVVKLDKAPVSRRVYRILQLKEKPAPSDPVCTEASCAGIIGRYLLQPDIFPALETLRSSGSAPLELTDALELIRAHGRPVYAFELESMRTDIGAAVALAGRLLDDF